MIDIFITRKNREIYKIEVSGHSGYDIEERDIVCASVSSALMLTVNAILNVAKAKCIADEKDAKVSLEMLEPNEKAQDFLKAFCDHIGVLSQDYSQYINLKYSKE